MKFHNRIILTFTVIILLLLGSLGYSVYFFYSAEYREEIDTICKQNADNFLNIIDMISESYFKTLNDYACWTEMATFVQTKDPKWADDSVNLGGALVDFSLIMIFDINGKQVHNNQRHTLPEQMKLTPEFVKSIFLKDKTNHFFYNLSGNIIEFYAATISDSDDPERKKQQFGYLFFGRVWDNKNLALLGKQTKSKLSIDLDNNCTDETIPNKGIIRNSYNLKSHDDRPIANLVIQNQSLILQNFYDSNHTRILNIVFFTIVLFLILLFVLYEIRRHVLKPIEKIIAASESEKYENLAKQLAGDPEFLPVAERIKQAFLQKEFVLRLNEKMIELHEITDEKDEFNRVLVEKLPDYVIIHNGKNIFYVNKSFVDRYGGTEEEIKSKDLLGFIADDYKDLVIRNMAKKMLGEEVSDYEISVLDKNNIIINVLVRSEVITYKQQQVLLAVLIDLTEIKKNTQNLRISEERFRFMTESIRDGLLIYEDSRLVFYNKNILDILNRDKIDSASFNLSDVIGEDNAVLISDYLENPHNELKTESNIYYSNNHKYFFNRYANYIKEDGKVLLYILITDITELKKAENVIKELNRELTEHKANLEELVKSRTKELSLSNNELRITLEDLQKSMDLLVSQEKLVSLGTMIAGIAHEINNPAQAIKFSLEAFRLNLKDIKQFIEEIFQIANQPSNDSLSDLKHLKRVVEFLDFDSMMPEMQSFIEQNTKAVERIQNIVDSTKRMAHAGSSFSQCNINAIINDAVVLLSGQVKNQINIKLDLDKNMPVFQGMEQELGQVFINLITNARDAILDNGHNQSTGLLEIQTFYVADRNNIKITFRDNGKGIPKELSNRIFDPFFTTKTVGKGTGLGLNIVFKIIDAHQGTIKVDSQVGIGTIFTIYLPLL